jgi:hypothetical protein
MERPQTCVTGTGQPVASQGVKPDKPDRKTKRAQQRAEKEAAIAQVLQKWCARYPEQRMPTPTEKTALAERCGVAVKNIEYWFWHRNKRRYSATSTEPLPADEYGSGGYLKRKAEAAPVSRTPELPAETMGAKQGC